MIHARAYTRALAAALLVAACPSCGSESSGSCGDGVRQGSEQCDDGNTLDTDGCLATCRLNVCGDGFLWTAKEECDDGNAVDYDGCRNDCRLPRCGDGVVQAGEQCDDGNLDDSDPCTADCQPASCGDGVVWVGHEECDDGNADDSDGCLSSCAAATCGDGVVWAGHEECDDGNADNSDACPDTCTAATCGDGVVNAGVEECDDANADNSDGCLDTCVAASCGDGFVQAGVEQCDDANADDTDDCLTSCIAATCGDGFVRSGVEGCDDGNADNSDGCLDTCVAASCGDGFVQAGVEQCDDGNADDSDACLASCVPATCGDGVVRAGVEECDDGNADDTDACLGTCALATCGDGAVWLGHEACDDGNSDNGDDCLASCVTATCGDGFLLVGAEACDDGNEDPTDACLPGCIPATCGDGFLHVGVEACDDGNLLAGDGCTPTCGPATCGDGVVQPPEACDDGNASNSDACLDSCMTASCGDGFLHAGVEECDDGVPAGDGPCSASCTLAGCGDGIQSPWEACDDGNKDNSDACLNTCVPAACGDGFLRAGVETCDDGNTFDGDACLVTCVPAACGDGVVWVGHEECDDGNPDDADACRTDCTSAWCGDSIVWTGHEECDDGNVDNTDGCLMSCKAFDWCEGFQLGSVSPASFCVSLADPKVKDPELEIDGQGIATVDGKPPEVTVDGTPAQITDIESCQPVPGILTTASLCKTLKVEASGSFAVGDHVIMVSNPVTQVCPRTVVFSVALPPTLTSVSPAKACAGEGTFTLTGKGFVSGTEVLFDDIHASEVQLVSPTTLLATFEDLPAGKYDVTVRSGPGCESTLPGAVLIVPNPSVYFVDPPVAYNGITLQVTAFVTKIQGSGVKFFGIRPSQTAAEYEPLSFTYDPLKPRRVQAVVPSGLGASFYDVLLEDAMGCTAALDEALNVTGSLTLALEGVEPEFGWKSARTPVDLAAAAAPPPGEEGFQNQPRVYLNPVTAGPGQLAAGLNAVGFVDAARITAVVPDGLTPGSYDVVVVNPDGAVGLLPAGFAVVSNPPPLIDTVSPGSVPSGAPVTVIVRGQNFSSPTVDLTCKLPAGPGIGFAASVATFTSTAVTTVVPAASMTAGMVCVVQVTNSDGSYARYSALGVTNPAENLPPMTLKTSMVVARRAPSIVVGPVTRSSPFLYAVGGDNGSGVALDSVEAASLSAYGELGSWRVLPGLLPYKRTLAAATRIGRFIYLVGGSDGTAPADTLLRAEILDPADTPILDDLSLDLAPAGLSQGVWSYRVSAVMQASDPDNPGGETLPGDPLPLQVPKGLPQPLKATLYWKALAGAKEYRVYRTPQAGMAAGSERLVGVVAAPAVEFTDTGLAADLSKLPRTPGDLGVWHKVGTLKQPLEGLGLGLGTDPANAGIAYLYAIAGRTTGSTLLKSYQYLGITKSTGLPVLPAGPFEQVTDNLLAAGRWQLGVFIVTENVTVRTAPGDTWLYAGSGLATGATIAKDVDAALVLAGGKLGTWKPVQAIKPDFAGYAFAAAANQLWVFGGQGGAPSSTGKSSQLCGTGNACGTPPTLDNWNAGIGLVEDRYLPGSTVGAAHIFVAGGAGSGGVVRKTVEATVW